MKRGMDFLTEVELGYAPPLEYIVKNMQMARAEQIQDDLMHVSKFSPFIIAFSIACTFGSDSVRGERQLERG